MVQWINVHQNNSFVIKRKELGIAIKVRKQTAIAKKLLFTHTLVAS